MWRAVGFLSWLTITFATHVSSGESSSPSAKTPGPVAFTLGWFGDDWVALVPPSMPAGLNARAVFADWGVALSADDFASGPVGGTLAVRPGPNVDAVFEMPAVFNRSPEGEGGGAMTLRFDSPLRRVRIDLGAESSTEAVVGFFGIGGTVLGEVAGDVGRADLVPTEFPFEDDDGIVRIEVTGRDAGVPVALLQIVAEFASPPSFSRCVPRVAHGAFPEGGWTLQTLLSAATLFPGTGLRVPEPVEVDLSLEFRDHWGAPLTVVLDDEAESGFEYALGYWQPRIARTTDSLSDLDAGYVCAASNYPFHFAAVYRVLDESGAPVSEAGIQGVRPGHRFVGVLQKEAAGETNTALALANVSDGEATAAVTFLLAPATTFRAEVALPARGHGAWFVDEEQLFPELFGRDAEGTLEIVSDAPVVATILRTIRGVVSASLPLDRQRTGLGD